MCNYFQKVNNKTFKVAAISVEHMIVQLREILFQHMFLSVA